MSRIFVALMGVGLLMGAPAADAGPEEDRLRLINHFRIAYPDIKFDDYVYGALVFDPDAKAKFDIVMQSPPHAAALGKGEQLWNTPLASGKRYADCLPGAGRNIVGNYPIYDDDLSKVVTLEDVINACRTANGEAPYVHADPETMGLLTAYLRTLSDGMKMDIKIPSAGARLAYEDGKNTFYRRAGQLNFSCANCHADNAGNRMRSEVLSPVLGQATHWPIFHVGEPARTLQKQYKICHTNMRHFPDKPGSVRYNNLEYFHSYISNGLPLRSSVIRK